MQVNRSVRDAWCTVSSADPAELDAEGLAGLLASITAVRSMCDAVEVLAVRRSRELNAAGASAPPEHVLANETGRSGRDARVAAAREQACDAMPAFEAGLAEGRVSSGHVDAAATAHAGLKESVADEFAGHADDLVARAGHVNVDVFERECRDLARHLTAVADRNAEADELERQRKASEVKRWIDRATGMHKTLISLDPLRDAKMWKVINAQLASERSQRQSTSDTPLPFSALQAEAVVNVVTAPSTATTSARPVPEISVLIDYDTIVGKLRSTGVVCETEDGTPLPASIVRQMAADAHIIPMLLGSQGEVLDQGRKVRTATPQQRSTLAAMHATCAFPGCKVLFSGCRIHHVRWWWEHNGPTDIDNLLPLCEQHHHVVHDGGWGLSLTPDRIATWTRPDGQLHHRGSTINRRAMPLSKETSPLRDTHDRTPRDVPLRR